MIVFYLVPHAHIQCFHTKILFAFCGSRTILHYSPLSPTRMYSFLGESLAQHPSQYHAALLKLYSRNKFLSGGFGSWIKISIFSFNQNCSAMKTTKIITSLLFCILYTNAFCQEAASIERIDKKLKANEWTISQVLSADSLMYLHSKTPFRNMIRANAREGSFSMITHTEPGTRVTIKASVKNKQGAPLTNALIYVYQTSDKGWYSDTAAHILINSGDINHARLFAYFKTDSNGNFSYETIRPRGYPNSDLPAHIHIHVWNKDGRVMHGPGELLFTDDDRLTPERRKRSIEDGFLISANSGTEKKPAYEYKIIVD